MAEAWTKALVIQGRAALARRRRDPLPGLARLEDSREVVTAGALP